MAIRLHSPFSSKQAVPVSHLQDPSDPAFHMKVVLQTLICCIKHCIAANIHFPICWTKDRRAPWCLRAHPGLCGTLDWVPRSVVGPGTCSGGKACGQCTDWQEASPGRWSRERGLSTPIRGMPEARRGFQLDPRPTQRSYQVPFVSKDLTLLPNKCLRCRPWHGRLIGSVITQL